MTYLPVELAAAQQAVFKDILRFQTTPLKTSGYLESFVLSGFALEELGQASAIVDAFINKSAFSKLAFNALKRASAHYILHDEQLPERLKTWVVDYLHDTAKEPSRGKSGPNRSELEHAFLLNCIDKVIAVTSLPIYPTETRGLENCALGVVAAASKEVKEKKGASMLPTTPKTMERRYLQARRWIEAKR